MRIILNLLLVHSAFGLLTFFLRIQSTAKVMPEIS